MTYQQKPAIFIAGFSKDQVWDAEYPPTLALRRDTPLF